ncbi:MAG: DUF302 domain-containing protein [Gammaproteobacteria bacterium]|nr:DUF302 domain-containing protein [Gammaproteobacteria bacterium]MDH5800237.1 DUF302 domain-containing protein [Gammaproteobacteria bacterium]
MKKVLVATVLLVLSAPFATLAADNGLITKKSKYSATETLDRLSNVLKKKGINIFARVSHKKNAEGVNLKLRPTELLIFGNPKLGTHFFTSRQTAGIDLPMKALAWEDADGQVWLTYNDPAYIAKRHGISDRDDVAAKMSKALDKMSSAASGN